MGKHDQYDFGGSDDGLPESADEQSHESVSEDEARDPSVSATETGTQSAQQSQASVDDIDVSSLPLKLRRDNVTDFRENKTIKLLSETQKAMEDDVLRFLSDEFEGETMHKTDAFEIIVWNGLYDTDGNLDTEGLKQQAKKMGYGLGEDVD